MQIEAIRAHPGSAHVMLYGTRRNPSCGMRGMTTAPVPAPALPRPRTRGSWSGEPQSWDNSPHHHPRAPQNSPRRNFQRKSLLLFHENTNPATSKSQRPLGCERRRDGGGKHHSKAFFPTKPQRQPPAGHCFSLALGSELMGFAQLQQKEAKQNVLNSLLWVKKAQRSHPHSSPIWAAAGDGAGSIPSQHFTSPGPRADLQGPDTGE